MLLFITAVIQYHVTTVQYSMAKVNE